jgi:hypothetical protein
MGRLPEPGDARAAFDLMDERAKATLPDTSNHMHDAGDLEFDATAGVMSGEAAKKFRLAYGDLFTTEEVLQEGGLSLLGSTAEVWLRENDVLSVLASLMLQSMAIGVLMERHRWEERAPIPADPAFEVPCPWCEAKAGEPCVTIFGRKPRDTAEPHEVRKLAWQNRGRA